MFSSLYNEDKQLFFYYHLITKCVNKQQATGRTRDGATFPLSISLKPKYGKDLKKLDRDKEFSANELFYKGMVWVFANISGLVTFTPEGVIHCCNHNFSMMLFGYQEKELVGRVSTFCEKFKYM